MRSLMMTRPGRSGYRWLEHTSELELCIDAPTEEGVFELAVAALGELVTDHAETPEGRCEDGSPTANKAPHGDREPLAREVTVAAGDRAALLVAFLEELVYLLETDDLVPERAERLEIAGERLIATVRGYRGSPRHLVKGVTEHGVLRSTDCT
jgi:SHS2 domain-containing protein